MVQPEVIVDCHYNAIVPKELEANLRYRLEILKAAENDPELQRGLIEMCRLDILFYVNTFVWTFDPRKEQTIIPFICYDDQEEALLAIIAAMRHKTPVTNKVGKQLLLRKVRDRGASWICCIAMDHQAQFEEMLRFFMLSYVADLVDKSDNPKCLFWKIDKIHEFLPDWMFDIEKDITRRIMGMYYHKTGSTVDGATTTARSGVGDRATAVFIDEFSRFDPVDAATVKGGLADVTPCRIWNFTVNPTMGKSHPSYDLVKQAEEGKLDCVTLHWKGDPEKRKGLYHVDRVTKKLTIHDKQYRFPHDYKFQLDGKFEWHSVWFDYERNDRNNDSDVAANMEFDWDKSGSNVFDEDVILQHAVAHSRHPDLEGDLLYDDTGHPKQFIPQRGGPIKLWMDLDNMKPPHGQYCAGADVSLGLGRTNSCFTGCRVATGEKVLEYCDPHLKPDEFAIKCVALCRWLSFPDVWCLFCWENSGPPGITFGNKVIQLGYSAVWIQQRDDASFGGKVITRKPGYSAQKGHYTLMMQYQSSLGSRAFINRSRLALDETNDWIWLDGKPVHKANANRKNDPSGAKDNHGDRTVADALCDKMRIHLGGDRLEEMEKQLVRPGCFAWYEQQMKLEERRKGDLYPNWNRRRR